MYEQSPGLRGKPTDIQLQLPDDFAWLYSYIEPLNERLQAEIVQSVVRTLVSRELGESDPEIGRVLEEIIDESKTEGIGRPADRVLRFLTPFLGRELEVILAEELATRFTSLKTTQNTASYIRHLFDSKELELEAVLGYRIRRKSK